MRTLGRAGCRGGAEVPDCLAVWSSGLSTGENAVQRGGEAKALDAKTGKESYKSGDAIATWVHFTGLAVSNGKIFAVDHDSNVSCFALAGK